VGSSFTGRRHVVKYWEANVTVEPRAGTRRRRSLPPARARRTLSRVSEASPRSPQLGALVALVFLAVLLRTAWLSDDALITLRTILNWTHGYGLTFNIAERVQTFTHPLWMLLLTGVYLVVGNVYYATFALSIGVSLVVFWRLIRETASPVQAWLVAGVLLLSRAFVDFSTSGLENPLSNLLLVWFVAVAVRPPAAPHTRLGWLWLIASLLYLTRPDDVLLVLPTLLWLTWPRGIWRRAERAAQPVARTPQPAVRAVLWGLSPAILWTLFALVYYGFPFPNTAYAKLATGIPRGEVWRQGLLYLVDSVDRDPITLVAILFGLAAGVVKPGLPRSMALGVACYLVYVVSIGGDFMAGRFLAVPLVLSLLIVGRLVPLESRLASAIAAVMLVVGLSSSQITLRSDSSFDARGVRSTGIIDERAVYFRTQSLVWAGRNTFAEPEWPSGRRQPTPVRVLETCGLMGAGGLAWGPMVHMLDECALADPLLARLPAVFNLGWRSGHFRRAIPQGYAASLEKKVNLISEPALRPLYEDLRIVTRSNRLFSTARLAAIWRVNAGVSGRGIDRRFYRHAGAVASLEEVSAIVPSQTPGTEARVLDRPLAVFCEDKPGRRFIEVSLDSDDKYELLFLKQGRLVTRMELGPIPQHRRQSGLAAYTEDLPASATERGFDTIVVAPAAGEAFAFGHLLLDGHGATDAELARRVSERDRLQPQ
jgi:arabinofuranosyltransferase